MRNHFKILGVHKDTIFDELKTAYRTKAAECHPDKPRGDTQTFATLGEAYITLINEYKREKYLREIEREFPKCVLCYGQGYLAQQTNFTERRKIVCIKCEGSGVIFPVDNI